MNDFFKPRIYTSSATTKISYVLCFVFAIVFAPVLMYSGSINAANSRGSSYVVYAVLAMAYLLYALLYVFRYRLTIDGDTIEESGLTPSQRINIAEIKEIREYYVMAKPNKLSDPNVFLKRYVTKTKIIPKKDFSILKKDLTINYKVLNEDEMLLNWVENAKKNFSIKETKGNAVFWYAIDIWKRNHRS